MPQEWQRDEYTITDDRACVEIDVVHSFLRTSYWAGPHLPREIVERAVENSLCFVVLRTDRSAGIQPASSVSDTLPFRGAGLQPASQVGFARVITDYATYAYVADVFVLPEHRGQKLGVWLMECIAAHPRLQNLRRWMLGTRDAHTLYEKSGWTRITKDDDRWMERADPGVYERMAREGAAQS